jgi:hypothetical protein
MKYQGFSRRIKKDDKTERAVINLAAIIVLLTTTLDARIAVGLAIIFQLALGIYHFARGSRQQSNTTI